MACLNLTNGLFINSSADLLWNSANTVLNLPNGGSLTYTGSGPNPGIAINKDGDNEFFSKPATGNIHYMNFGSPKNYLLVLTTQDGGGISTRSVVLVDTSGSSIQTRLLFTINANTSQPLPVVQMSPGGGHLFFIRAATSAGTVAGMQIARSDNGAPLCSAVPFSPSLELFGEVTPTAILIKEGGSTISSCARPEADCDVSPNSQTFNDAVLGPGVDPSLATQTEQFTIENNGTDCLTITSIGNAGPFSVSGTSQPLPVTLDPMEDITVNVLFAPANLGNYSEQLPINPTPTNGDTYLECNGEARAPELSISFSGSVSFGKVPLGASANRMVSILNNGEATVNISIPAPPGGIPFSWGPFGGPLAPGASHTLVITFAPMSEGSFNHTITFTGNDPDSPHQINLSGTGCVANAEMQVLTPPGPFIDFGNVQRGFRTVRTIRVRNNGDGPLNFSARIQGGDDTLFGIQKEGESITSPLANTSFTVLPTDACGGTSGSGEVIFGVTFYANDAPRTAQSQLVIYNHNATNGLPNELTYDLQGEITAPIAVDVQLVMDRSGSMSDPSGERIKIDTAIDAGQLFVEMMRPDVEDRLGIVKFNDTPELVSSIQNITTANRDTIRGQINPTEFNPTGFTSIAGGVRVAIKNIDDTPRATVPDALNTSIVVLTDGIDNTPYNDPDGNTYSLLGGDGALPLPAPTGKQLYAIGIGNSIDSGQLSVLSQATGGSFLHVRDFSGTDFFSLEKHFTQIFMESVDLSVISDPVYTIQPNDEHVTPIDILNGDTGLMIVVYDRDYIRLPFYLESPSGEIVTLTQVPAGFQIRPGITATARFMEVTFPEGAPERYAGQWKFIVYHDGKACVYKPRQPKETPVTHVPNVDSQEFGFGFRPTRCKEGYDKPVMYGFAVGAGSNFRMFPFVQPGIIKVGESIKLNALISEFSLPVTGCTVTVKAETPGGTVYNYTLLDDGLHADDDKDDGNYGKVFTQTSEEGFYTFTFRAHGYSRDNEPVVREAVRSKYVEGNTPLIPSDGGNRPDDGDGSSTSQRCCRTITYLLWVIIVLILILIYLRWFR